MSDLNTAITPETTGNSIAPQLYRRSVEGTQASVFTDIYQEETNIAIWQRELPTSLQSKVEQFLNENPTLQKSMIITPEDALADLNDQLDGDNYHELTTNIAELVDMFCCLFDLKRAGLRLTTLDRAMCPKFHVDRVPCRLVTTYQGAATEWLPHQLVNREKLGRGSNGKSDSKSGLYQNQNDIQQLTAGDVALLKGEVWEGNENAGLVHRSPALSNGEKRLLLTLDFA